MIAIAVLFLGTGLEYLNGVAMQGDDARPNMPMPSPQVLPTRSAPVASATARPMPT